MLALHVISLETIAGAKPPAIFCMAQQQAVRALHYLG